MRVLCAVLFCVTNGVAYAQGSPPPSLQPTASPDQPKEQSTPSGAQSGELTAKNPLLFALIVQPLFERAGTSLSSGVGSLFGRLFKWFGGSSEADPTSQPAQEGTNFPAPAGSYAPAQEGTYFQGQVGTYAPGQAKLASKLVPSIIYTV